jgi:hypothetical protein
MQPWQQGPQAGRHTHQEGLRSLQAGQQQQQAFHHSRGPRSLAAGCAGALVCLLIIAIVAYLAFIVRL